MDKEYRGIAVRTLMLISATSLLFAVAVGLGINVLVNVGYIPDNNTAPFISGVIGFVGVFIISQIFIAAAKNKRNATASSDY